MKSTEQLTGLTSNEIKIKSILYSLIDLFRSQMNAKYPETKALDNMKLLNFCNGFSNPTVERKKLRQIIMRDLDLTKKDTANSWIEVLCAKGYIEENTKTLSENGRADNNTRYEIIIDECVLRSEELRIKHVDFCLSQAEAKKQKEIEAQKKKGELDISRKIMADLLNYSNQSIIAH